MPATMPDPFSLQPLLYPALPIEPELNPDSPAALGRSLRCAEPFGAHLYIGTSDGKIHCFKQDALGADGQGNDAQEVPQPPSDGQRLAHVSTRTVSSKPIERILVLSDIAVAAVCTEATLSFYALPGFDPIPQQVLPHTKGVAAIALDEAQHGSDAEGLLNLCIIRRKGITLVKMSVDTWRVVTEIPLPSGATAARRFGKWLCISTTSDYSVVDLDEATISSVGLPISQTSEAPSASSRPSIIAIEKADQRGTCEFLITSHSNDLTLGVFVSQEGEPTSKLIEWPSHPRALALDYPHLHALLRNDTIEVHDVTTCAKSQTVHLPPLLEPRTLSAASSRLELQYSESANTTTLARVRFQNSKLMQVEDDVRRETASDNSTSTIHSKILLIGKNAVQCLAPNRTLDAVLKSLRRGSYYDTKDMLAHVRLDGPPKHGSSISDLEEQQLHCVQQWLGVESLRRFRFEDAALLLQEGQFPAALFARMVPSLSADLRPDGDVDEGYADVIEAMIELGDMIDFPATNLLMNYSPPLDLDDADLKTLLATLQGRTRHFLRGMLGWYREHARDQHLGRRMLDTMLVRVLIADHDRASVSAFLADPSSECDVNLIESGLESVGCYAALTTIARNRGDVAKTLDLQSKLLDGSLEDPAFHGSLQDFANILTSCDDAELSHRYGIWLVQRDTTAGIKVLTKGKGSIQSTDDATFKELSSIDEGAAMAFLEATALGRKQQDVKAHDKVFRELLKQIKSALQDDQERQMLQTVSDDYIAGAYAESFVAHLSLRSDEAKSVIPRLKLMLLLQGSLLLDPSVILTDLDQIPEFDYERAILHGKLGQDEQALELLAIKLRDANSAETYCSQARRPLSAVLVHSLGDVPQLKTYVTFAQRALRRRGPQASGNPTTSNGHRDDVTAIDNITLIKKLLRVYMKREEVSSEFQIATSHLLNTQAMHLSAIDVLETVPDHWSTKTLETFLSRSLRREMHRANEGHIQRAMALAQNLEVAQDLWSQRRAMGGVIQEDEGADDGDDAPGATDVKEEDGSEFVEKMGAAERGSQAGKLLVEKAAPPQDTIQNHAIDVVPDADGQ